MHLWMLKQQPFNSNFPLLSAVHALKNSLKKESGFFQGRCVLLPDILKRKQFGPCCSQTEPWSYNMSFFMLAMKPFHVHETVCAFLGHGV